MFDPYIDYFTAFEGIFKHVQYFNIFPNFLTQTTLAMHKPIPKFSDLKTHLLCSQI